MRRDVKPIYTAVNADAARVSFEEMAERWGQRYPAIVRLWDNAWNEFIPFLDYDIEIRRVLCSTNAIESLNARYRRAVKARGHFPIRAGRPEMLVLGDPITGPDRARSATMGGALEAGTQRLLDHLRRPLPGRRDLLTNNAGNTVNEIVPAGELVCRPTYGAPQQSLSLVPSPWSRPLRARRYGIPRAELVGDRSIRRGPREVALRVDGCRVASLTRRG